MKRCFLVSTCLLTEASLTVFSFHGFYLGEKINKVVLINSGDNSLAWMKGQDYIILMEVSCCFKGVLQGYCLQQEVLDELKIDF